MDANTKDRMERLEFELEQARKIMNDNALFMWVIYWNPTDFPHRYVVRRWSVAAGSAVGDDDPVAVVETLDEARRSVPKGLVHLGRAEADQRQIVEVWL